MATLYKSNGEIIENIEPANGRRFTLEELYKLLNCAQSSASSSEARRRS